MDLNFEESDFAVRVLKAVVPQLTRRQLECSYLLAYGLTQEQVGDVLGIERVSVKTHWRIGLDKIREMAKSLNQTP